MAGLGGGVSGGVSVGVDVQGVSGVSVVGCDVGWGGVSDGGM